MDTRDNNLRGPRSHRSQVARTMIPSPIRRRSQLCRPLRGGQLRRCLDTGSIRWRPGIDVGPPPARQRSVVRLRSRRPRASASVHSYWRSSLRWSSSV